MQNFYNKNFKLFELESDFRSFRRFFGILGILGGVVSRADRTCLNILSTVGEKTITNVNFL